MNVPDLFKSRKFWTALVGLLFMVVVEFVPQLAESSTQLQEAALVIIGLVIGGFAAQDVAQAARTGKTKYDRD